MKTLILGISRSGTTSLRRGFAEQNFLTIGEPFNELITGNRNYPLEELSSDSDICVKTLCDQVPKNIDLSFDDFIKLFVKDFDKIILLDRKNNTEHEESFLHLHWRISKNENTHVEWTGDIVPSDFRDNFYHHKHHTHLYLQKEQLKKVSNFTNTDITWYEDLYGTDRNKSLEIINNWNIENLDSNKLNDYLHPKNKLKKADKKSMI